jgi:hypothetical protein
VSAIGTKRMSWGEALRITERLSRDPASHVGAAIADWEYPVPHEALVLMNLYDLTHQIAWAQGGGKGTRPKPHPRPWRDQSKRHMRPTVSQEVVLAALRMAGHTGEPPSLN